MSLTQTQLTEIADKCLKIVTDKQTELEQTRLRLEGASEGIQFLVNSLKEVIAGQEAAGGKDNKPISTIAKI